MYPDTFRGQRQARRTKRQFERLKGYWSRRITQEHRLVYRVTDEIIYVLSYCSHYE